MKLQLPILVVFLFLAGQAFAQDKAEITVKITKNGDVVTDTTFIYNNIEKAKQAAKLIDLMASEEYNHNAKNEEESNVFVFYSKEGELKEIDETESMNVTVKSNQSGEDEKRVIVEKKVRVKTEDDKDDELNWTIEEGEDGQIIVISEDEQGNKKIKKFRADESAEDGAILKKRYSEDGRDVEITIIKKKIPVDEDQVEMEVTVETEEKNEKKRKEK